MEITSLDGKPITTVRYAWADNPGNLNLVNSEGLLAHPFRTDNYKGLVMMPGMIKLQNKNWIG